MTGQEDVFQKAMSEGHSAAWDQDWEKAVDSYQKALAEFPDNAKALTSLGLALYQLNQFDDALKAYIHAAQVSPNDPIPLEKVAQLSERVGELKQAIQASTRAAELYIQNQDVDKAIENWLRITQLEPDHITAHSRLAMVHEKLGHIQPAVTEYLSIASLLQRAGQGDKAAEMIGRALHLMPQSNEARQALALLKSGQLLPKPQRSKGATGPLRMAQVREMRQKTLPKDSGLDPISEARQRALTRMAEFLFEFTDENIPQSPKRGLRAIMRGTTGQLSLQKDDRPKIVIHLSQAIDAQTHGQDAEAADELENALEAGFNHPAVYFDLGYLRSTGNRLESALRHLQYSVKHVDYAMAARLLMGQIHQKQEHHAEAAIEYMEALKLADAAVVKPEQSDEIRQLYEPLVEGLASQKDVEVLQNLSKNISELLLKPSWRTAVAQARQQLPKDGDEGMLLPVAEILTEAQSSQVIDSIRSVHELARAGYLRSAVDEAFNAIRMAPTYLPLHTLIGDLLVKEGRQQEAITKYSVVAQAYNVRGESSQAINVLRRVIQLAPMDLTVRNRLIEQLVARGHTDEAINEYIDLADIYYRLAELDTARKTFTTALRLAQQSEANREWSIRLLRRMADIDMQRLDWKQALRIYEQLRTLNPDDIAIRKNLIDLNIRLNQANQAHTELEGFLVHLDGSNRRGEALPLMEALVEESPNNPLLMRYMAEEYRRAGRIQDAVAQLDAAGEILLDASDTAGAIQALEAIIAMNPPNIEQYQAALHNLKTTQ